MLKEAANVLNLQTRLLDSSSLKFIGMHIGANRRTIDIWHLEVEVVRSRLSRLKNIKFIVGDCVIIIKLIFTLHLLRVLFVDIYGSKFLYNNIIK